MKMFDLMNKHIYSLCLVLLTVTSAIGCHAPDALTGPPAFVQPGTSLRPLGTFSFHGDLGDGIGDEPEPLTVCELVEGADTVAIVSTTGGAQGTSLKRDCSTDEQPQFSPGSLVDVEVWAVIAGQELPSSTTMYYGAFGACSVTPGATHLVALRAVGNHIVTQCVPIEITSDAVEAVTHETNGYYSLLPRNFEAFVEATDPLVTSFQFACGHEPRNLDSYRQMDTLSLCPVPKSSGEPAGSVDDEQGDTTPGDDND